MDKNKEKDKKQLEESVENCLIRIGQLVTKKAEMGILSSRDEYELENVTDLLARLKKVLNEQEKER